MNTKKDQRKWVREEVVVLVVEYFRTKNLTKAVEWYQKAAAQGDDYAIYRLRQMAEE